MNAHPSDWYRYALGDIVLGTLFGVAFSIGIFWLTLGHQSVIAARAIAIDFLPQTAGLCAMGTIVPTLITRRRLVQGTAPVLSSVPWLPKNLLLRAASLVTAAVLIAAVPAMLLVLHWAADGMNLSAALTLKGLYGGALGAVVAAPVCRAALGDLPTNT